MITNLPVPYRNHTTKTHVPKLISYVPKSSCTETDHLFVPKLSCIESDLTHLGSDSLGKSNDLSVGMSSVSQIHFEFGVIVNPDPDPIIE